MPLSKRPIADELLDVLERGIDGNLGGDPDNNAPREGEARGAAEIPDFGNESRYQPPVYVSAMSWCSVAGFRPACALPATGISIHPTVHRSSSGISAVDDRCEDVEIEICDDCAGIRYCA